MKKRTYIITAILLFFLFFLLYINNFPCGNKEINLQIPEYLKNATIVFERDMVYISGLKSTIGGCTKTIKNTDRHLSSQESIDMVPLYADYFRDGTKKIIPVPSDIQFTIIRSFIVHPSPLLIDAEDVTYFLLKDKNSILSVVPIYEVEWYDKNRNKKYAGYYKDGKRIGNVTVYSDMTQ